MITSQGFQKQVSPTLTAVCQGRAFNYETIIQTTLAVCGGNYNEAYFRMLQLPISDLIRYWEQWLKLQEKSKPQNTPENIKGKLANNQAVNLGTNASHDVLKAEIAKLEAQDAFNPKKYKWSKSR